MSFKVCKKCGVEKSLDDFHKSNRHTDGKRSACKKCRSLDSKIYRILNKEKIKNRNKKYYKKNKKEILERNKQYRENNKEKMSQIHKNYRELNKDEIAKRSKKYAQENKDKVNTSKKKHRDKNKNNPSYKILMNSRSRLYYALKGTNKYKSAIELLGCTAEEARKYLEDQFQEGMTWENYGNPNGDHSNCWHVDHSRPCASFDLSDPQQQKECFHYTNLQPLWAKDNLSKGSKYDESNPWLPT